MSLPNLHALVFLGAALLVPPVAGAERYALMKLDYALKLANPNALPDTATLTALKAGTDGDKARGLLLHHFDQRWLNGSSGRLGVPLFETAAAPFSIFGLGNQELPKRLDARGSPPAATGDGDFLAYLRRALPSGSVSQQQMPKIFNPAAGTAAVVAHFHFLEDVARASEADAVISYFQLQYWDTASSAQAATYQPLLAARKRATSTAVRTRLGRRVFSLPVADWPNAGETLIALADDSGLGRPAFLRKAADTLSAAPEMRSGAAGSMLEMLVVSCSPDQAAKELGLTAVECDVEWFVWCHDQVGIIDHLLDSPTAARDLTKRLITFCLPDDDAVFIRLFPMARRQYYERGKFPATLQNLLFDDLLLPKAARGEAGGALVLNDAHGGTWRHDHRHTLAIMIFRGGPPDSPAWKTSAISRLKFSNHVYQHLLDGRASPDIQAHVDLALLRLLLEEYLRRFKVASDDNSGPAALDKAEGEFKPLLDHLSECRRRSADLSRSGPLRQFKTSLAEATIEVLADLKPGASDPAIIQRFVRRFKMALRVDRLVQPLTGGAGKVPEWVSEVTKGIRTRVFDLPETLTGQSAQQPRGPVTHWHADVLVFRVRVLVDITMDKDFREVLAGSALEDHVFEDLLLPLVRVAGVLRQLCPAPNQTDWPHAAWAKGKPARLAQLFKALDTAEPLDCFAGVCVIATLAHERVWRTKPDQIFTGVWSLNADLKVFRWLLENRQPEAADTITGAGDIKGLANLAYTRWPEEPATEEAWERATWIEHLLTAGEWQAYPFHLEDKPTGWENPVLPLEGRKHWLPFRFTPSEAQMDSTRLVDGRVRLVILGRLIRMVESDPRPARLEFVCNAAVLLPNSAHNDAGKNKGQPFDEPKLALLRLVARQLQSGGADQERFLILLQCYLRLGASLSNPAGVKDNPRGGLPADLPTPIEIIGTVLARAPALAVELGSLREELRRLLISRERRSHGGTLAMLRDQLDGVLGHGTTDGTLLRASWSGGDRDLIARDYGERLKQVGEGTIRDFLRVRRDLLQLLKSAAGDLNEDDARRVQRFFGWVDWLLFFSRTDWKSGHGYLALRAPCSKGGEWWPALALLCAGTPALQDACAKVDLIENRPLMLDLFRLNEAALGVLDAIMAETDAARRRQMLDFEHELFWTELHLGILARTEHHDLADARTLAENAFHGALRDITLATSLQKEPDDQVLEERLFVALDSSLGNDRRGEPIISLDGAVRLAAKCHADETLPESVRKAAPALLRAASSMGKAGLLGGAATPSKVMELLFKLHDTSLTETSEFWREFYDKALTKPGADGMAASLADSFRVALAQPFFRQTLDGQRGGISSVVSRWRGVAGTPNENGCALTSACRGGWGPVIDDLLNGKGREDEKAPFLWQVVADFEKRVDAASPLNPLNILAEPPQEFLTLNAWLLDFWKDEDPKEIRDYFNPMQEAAQP